MRRGRRSYSRPKTPRRATLSRRPGLPAILLTGYVGDVPADAFQSLKDKPFALLLKPAAPARVLAQLADLLAQVPA